MASNPKPKARAPQAAQKSASVSVPDDLARRIAREALYTLSPAAWANRELGIDLDDWQKRLIQAPGGSRVISLVHRQAGKTTAGSVGVAHTMLRRAPGSTNLVLAPTQKQSAEFVRRLRGHLVKIGAKLKADNAFSVELADGGRCIAMPGSDDASIRGLTITGDLIIDEAARVSDALYDAARPMLIRHADKARLILLSTAWTRDGFFYRVWADGSEKDWIKVEAIIHECRHLTPEIIEAEQRAMPASVFAREYLNVFDSIETRFFNTDSLAAAFGENFQSPTPDTLPEGAEVDPVVYSSNAFTIEGNSARAGRRSFGGEQLANFGGRW